MSRVSWMLTFAYLACGTAAVAQSVPASSPQTLAEAFGARERILDASLSPSGTRIALVSPGPGQSAVVQVMDLTTKETKPVNYADGKPLSLNSCGWASDTRLVCTLYGVAESDGPLLGYQRLIAFDADGGNVTSLSAVERKQRYIQQSDGYVLDWRDGTSNEVLLVRNYVPTRSTLNSIGSMSEGLGVDLLDTATGKVKHIESADPLANRYISDGNGVVRIMGRDTAFRYGYQTRGQTSFVYRTPGQRQWLPLSTYDSTSGTGMWPVAVDGRTNMAYVLEKLDGRDALYRVSLDGSLKKELVLANPKVDISGVIRVGRHGRVVAASYSDEHSAAEYFDAAYADLVEKLRRALPKLPIISVIDSSADERKHLVYAASDTDPGRYYLFDQDKKQLSLVGAVRPQVADAKIGVQQPITYKASDGTVVPGYLTRPPGSEGKKLPAIVMPHGGPESRDEWGFDWLAQFFVSRGYAVIQPNYRGSSGYGEEWIMENGFRSWKTAISDINDAGRWMVAEGIADPDKLAIVGWSYGGYAALQSNVLDPDLFKAAVAIAPVTDLEMLRNEQKGFTNTRLAQAYIGEGPNLVAGSPTRFADKFKAPVLMFHGDIDINVGVAQSRAMQQALTKSGKPVDLIVYPGIAHSLSDSAVRSDMLARTDAFLTRTLAR
ncbi:S9 family peptidase [Sphingomonas sp. BGYR3]|uniref:alpha/beta hydrolase family protein n=1 Tax=Sphingomonas sp. BGYR3 TaxID=2975483 RepID=UPI0021A77E69|nr:S9 family peptidase [Sphingomonas sp. BGYR3]MDG5489599.1 S9 family peptidase [Sphingomonas sp. BGYR3]